MVGPINKSQTLYYGYLGASHGVEHNQEELCVLFIHMHVCTQTFWELFSQYDFSCLTVSQVGHYLHPLELGIEQGMDHNPLGADCKGGINC